MNSKTRIVMITGASAGVGRATAHAFAREKAQIGLLARGQQGLTATQREVEALGGQALILKADVADAGQVEAAAAALEKSFGSIDIWINNAMTSVFSTFSEMTAEEFQRVTNVTYLGYVHGTMAALKRMRARDRGLIVQVGSALSYRGIPLQSAYCGAKHAIQGFSESVRCELIHERSAVWITQVNLPAMNTPQFRWVKSRLQRKPQPVPPIFQPEVAARAIVWASRQRRREVNVGLPTTLAIVGNNFCPAFADRYLARTGYDSQQLPEPDSPDRPFNLWTPVDADQSAHGDFDKISKNSSTQLWFIMHNGKLWALLAAILIIGCTICRFALRATN